MDVVKGKKFTFTFVSSRHKGFGNIPVGIPVSNNFLLSFNADVVDVDVPLPLGLDLLTRASLILGFADDELLSKSDGWNLL